MKNIDAIMQASGFMRLGHKTDHWYTREGTRKIFVESKHGLRAVRDVRASLIALAAQVAKDADVWAYLILLDPRLSLSRLEEEWSDAAAALRQDVRDRMGLVILTQDATAWGLPYDRSPMLVSLLHSLEESIERQELPTRERPDTFFMVLKILLHRWLLDYGPMTTSLLMEMAGCSYPTVAKALQRLGHLIHRHSDRRIELNRFPQKDWEELLLTSDKVRSTMRFVDRSGKPRTPDALLQRLYRLKPERVAVGGVCGTRYWYPSLNLHGTPRLDLCVHAPGSLADLSFVEQLDPALVSVNEPVGSVSLAIHFVYQAMPLFCAERELAVPWADPVECLLDLHELHLVEQAHEMIEALVKRGRT